MRSQSRMLLAAGALGIILATASCTGEGLAPSRDVTEADLEGIWIADYGAGTSDKIELAANGLFQQEFLDVRHDYRFATGWRGWRLERYEDGYLQVHLKGARYFLEGIERAEADGRIDPTDPCLTPTDCDWGLRPFAFYDPFRQELMHMVGELVLIVRTDSGGNLMLHHVWTSGDRGFALIGGEQEVFRRISGQ